MSQSFTLTDSQSLSDLIVFLSRSGRVLDGSARLIASKGVLAVYTAIFYPRGLLDASPTVLGLRTFALQESVDLDKVVPVRSLLERLKRLESTTRDLTLPVIVTVPLEVNTVTWAGISPPKGGWEPHGQTPAAHLEAAARSGIDEVAAAVPEGAGELIVERVRSEVWSRQVDGLEFVPTGAGFAAFSLGFLAEGEPVQLYESGLWTRLSTSRGHVLVRRKPWTITA
ncbi:hypothetical protein [Cryobacterium sp. PH29-G1]|uniref:hypothetical protein n=1 Tax=Cryobacterium sp. PH29-G1 TaxID=3046211 RepID=UPI0024B99C51|nr:hypothetical protein [Cryobacterium sp. PH29-G1]MDJ0349272.1 hypothetical protein [Cryobacterium sp. PH29-G1]